MACERLTGLLQHHLLAAPRRPCQTAQDVVSRITTIALKERVNGPVLRCGACTEFNDDSAESHILLGSLTKLHGNLAYRQLLKISYFLDSHSL